MLKERENDQSLYQIDCILYIMAIESINMDSTKIQQVIDNSRKILEHHKFAPHDCFRHM